jgi:outer membrane protein assembly factor BamB
VVIQQARSVAVADGDVFVAGDATNTGLEHDQWEVMSLGAADGAQRWLEAGDTITGANMEVQALIVVGGNVIVAPMTGPLTALRASSGATVWSGPELPVGANITTMLNYATSDGTHLYVMSHAFSNSNGTIMNFPVRLMAMEPSDGSVLWSRSLDPYMSPETLTMSDGVLLSGKNITATTGYDGFNENGSLLWAYDTTSGTELWRDNSPPTGISWDLSAQMTPLGGNGVVYLEGIESNFTVHPFTCLVFCPGVSWLYAINVRTGKPWWRVPTGYVSLVHLVF